MPPLQGKSQASNTTAEDRVCPVCSDPHATRTFLQINDLEYLRCDRCLATFLTRTCLPSPNTEHTHYLSHENDIFDERYRRHLSKLSVPLLEKLAPNSLGLDYGCGPGPALAQMMIEAGQNMHLFDPFFSQALPQAPHQSRVGLADIQYNFITCTETAEHFHAPADEFARFDKMLKPGGWLGLMTCFQDDDERFASWHYRKDPTHVVFYKSETLGSIAADLGWTIEIPTKDVVLMQKHHVIRDQ